MLHIRVKSCRWLHGMKWQVFPSLCGDYPDYVRVGNDMWKMVSVACRALYVLFIGLFIDHCCCWFKTFFIKNEKKGIGLRLFFFISKFSTFFFMFYTTWFYPCSSSSWTFKVYANILRSPVYRNTAARTSPVSPSFIYKHVHIYQQSGFCCFRRVYSSVIIPDFLMIHVVSETDKLVGPVEKLILALRIMHP